MARKTDDDEKMLTTDDKFEMLLEVLAQRQSPGIDIDALREVLSTTQLASADAMKRALKPENDTHPGKSVFSYPEGDLAKPRPVLPFEFYYNNYPVHKFPETEHWRELELMMQVQPGEYTVLRKDGSPMAVTVKAERNAVGAVTKLLVEFPILREEKSLVPPKTVVLYQLVHSDNPRKRFVEAMHEYLDQMTADPIGAAV